jgi:hypothetical protein
MLFLNLKKISLHILISLFISVFSFSPAHAISESNCVEAGFAVSAMVMDMVSNHYALQKNASKKAKILQCVTKALSLSSKGMFFVNNIEAKRGVGGWNGGRDCVAMGALTALDTKNLIQNLYDLSQGEPKDEDSLVGEEENDENSTVQKLNYFRRVFLQPIFKGLTSFAVAMTQNYATSYSGDKARYTATAAHCFANVLEEYSNLPAESKLEEVVICALIANALWLAHEGKEYAAERAAIRGNERYNVCAGCNQEHALNVLACNHAAGCANCLRLAVQAPAAHNRNEVFCLDPACRHHGLNRHEVQKICGNDPETMREYDEAHFRNPNPQRPVPPVAVPVPPPGPDEDDEAPEEEEEEEPAIVPAPIIALPVEIGDCLGCLDDAIEVKILACGHRGCAGCLRGKIQADYANRGVGEFDHIKCLHGAECNAHMNRNEVRALVNDDAAIVQAFDDAVRRRALPAPAEGGAIADGDIGLNRDQRLAAGIRRCPNCRLFIQRNGGCNAVVCRNRNAHGVVCHYEFCWACGGNYARHHHEPNPACPAWRAYNMAGDYFFHVAAPVGNWWE